MEFYSTFRAMVERLQGDTESELDVLERAIARVEDLHPEIVSGEAEGDAADLMEELKQLRQRKIALLGK